MWGNEKIDSKYSRRKESNCWKAQIVLRATQSRHTDREAGDEEQDSVIVRNGETDSWDYPNTPGGKTGPDDGPVQVQQNMTETVHGNSIHASPSGQDKTWGKKLNWTQIAKVQRPVQKGIPPALLKRIRRSQKALNQQQMRVRMEPWLTALYFKNMCRGTFGALRGAVSECFPKRAILGLRFLGGSI